MKKIIIYDFDGTLTPYPMPKLEILEKCGINIRKMWNSRGSNKS